MARKKKVIAIDSGKFNLKGRSGKETLSYNTKYSIGHTDEGMLTRSYNITYKGQELTIGDNGEISDGNVGKDSDVHIWSTLTAIALLKGDATDIILMYGESYNEYARPEQKEAIKNRLEGKHKIIVDGIEYEFNITLCHILPEGLGCVLLNLLKHMELGVQYIIDWGGTTVNFLEVVKGKPTENSVSFQLGSHNVTAIVRKELQQRGLGKHSKIQVETWVNKGCSTNKEIQNVIDMVINKQLNRIDAELSDFGINIHDCEDVDFVGGSSKQFSNEIKKHYKMATIHNNADTSTVDGFYEYGRLKYGE